MFFWNSINWFWISFDQYFVMSLFFFQRLLNMAGLSVNLKEDFGSHYRMIKKWKKTLRLGTSTSESGLNASLDHWAVTRSYSFHDNYHKHSKSEAGFFFNYSLDENCFSWICQISSIAYVFVLDMMTSLYLFIEVDNRLWQQVTNHSWC